VLENRTKQFFSFNLLAKEDLLSMLVAGRWCTSHHQQEVSNFELGGI